jgi:hypothetical protein
MVLQYQVLGKKDFGENFLCGVSVAAAQNEGSGSSNKYIQYAVPGKVTIVAKDEDLPSRLLSSYRTKSPSNFCSPLQICIINTSARTNARILGDTLLSRK